MKKIIKALLMLTCVFALTACGAEETVSEVQQNKIDVAKQRVSDIITVFESIVNEGQADEFLDNYDNVELSALFEQSGYRTEGTAVRSAITSFKSGIEDMGGISEIGDVSAEFDEDTITVTVNVTGANKNGKVELIFSNDIFLSMESCTLNVDETFGSLMEGAALNTLLGMGTVFVVLILISIIIAQFGRINKFVTNREKKNEQAQASAPAPAPTPVIEQPQAEEELSDDEELVAVIAAAIAAYEGTSTEGFQVRSIKRASNGGWKKH